MTEKEIPLSQVYSTSQASKTSIAYVGGRSHTIGVFRFDHGNGSLQHIQSQAVPDADPAFLAFSKDGTRLYAADESWDGPGGLAAFEIKDNLGRLNPLNTRSSDSPVHLTVDPSGRWLLAVSYTTGQLMSFPLDADGKVGPEASRVYAGQKAHQVVIMPSGRVLVPCLGSQGIAQFNFHEGSFTPADVPFIEVSGDGPRHLATHPFQPWVYLVNEHSSTIQAFAISDESVIPLGEEWPTTSLKQGNTAAEVQVHPSGRFVYSSNRGDDSIAVFEVKKNGDLEPVAVTKSGGATPRHFSIDPSGAWMLVAHEGSSSVTTLSIDQATGKLTKTGFQVHFASPQFVEILPTHEAQISLQ